MQPRRHSGRPLVMGILNVTPDSFSDGGEHDQRDAALAWADAMIAEGADLIDVGGESTRPGAEPVSVDVELARVMPVIENLAPRHPVSIDTRHAEVARVAVAAGASIINDVSATLAPVAADTGAGWVAMHMLGAPGTMQDHPHYDDVLTEVRDFLVDRAQEAVELGVTDVWIDPGFGFGKNFRHNLELLAGLDTLVATSFPVVVGTSRKSMLGTLLARSDRADKPVPASDRLEGSVATATFALQLGVQMIRVHDVKATCQAVSVVHGSQPGTDSVGKVASSTESDRDDDVEGRG